MKHTPKKTIKNRFKKVRIFCDIHLKSLGEGIFLIIIAIIASLVSVKFINFFFASSEQEITGFLEATVGAISAGFVVWQLKSGDMHEKHLADVEEASFIQDFNRSFIENKALTEIERYLECRLTGARYGEFKNLAEHRQDMVNYLVYLEGLASCIHSNVLSFERIDDLLAYRFFLAMNHIDPQTIDLLPYASYYRGCFRLYDEWLTYRISCLRYTEEDDWEIPLFSTALCNYYGYEKYACPEMTISCSCDPETIRINNNAKLKTVILHAQFSEKEWVKLTLDLKDTPGKIAIISSKKMQKEKNRAMYLSLLRRILKELVYAEQSEDLQAYSQVLCLHTITGDPEVEKMYNAIKYTKAIKLASEAKEKDLEFVQLTTDSQLTDIELGDIASLIYDTDEFIFPDMFGSKANAVKVLPALFKNNSDTMFKQGNLFVCKIQGRVIGIILWHQGTLNWSSDLIKEKLKILLGETSNEYNKISISLDEVEKEYMHKYTDTNINSTVSPNISLLNICIDPNVRGKKIASDMLRRFLAAHSGKDMELCVLSQNTSAISLYKRNGFSEVYEEDAYPHKINHKRKVMIRKKEKTQ